MKMRLLKGKTFANFGVQKLEKLYNLMKNYHFIKLINTWMFST